MTIETRTLEGVEYRRTTVKYWADALRLREDWHREGFTARVDLLSEEHAAREPEPGGERCLVWGHRAAWVHPADIKIGACRVCGGDCAVRREGTPGFGAWSWLQCLRCGWNDRPRTAESGELIEYSED